MYAFRGGKKGQKTYQKCDFVLWHLSRKYEQLEYVDNHSTVKGKFSKFQEGLSLIVNNNNNNNKPDWVVRIWREIYLTKNFILIHKVSHITNKHPKPKLFGRGSVRN